MKDIIETFLDDKLIKSKNTRRNYRMNIQTYFKNLNKDIDPYVIDTKTWKRYDEDKQEELEEQYNSDLRKVYHIQYEQGRPDLSMRTFFNSIKQFMVSNNRYLKDLEFWDTLKNTTKGAEPASDEAILNANDLKTILSHGNALSRAIFLMLASSGRRISEILAITPDDVDITVTPTTLNIKKSTTSKTTKTKMKTICYISNEANDAYKAWMKERDFYLKTKRCKYKNEKDPRVFPMTYSNALLIWKTLLMKAELVDIEHYKNKWTGRMSRRVKKKNKGDRLLQHPHCLRKFFRSYLGNADFAEYLMGHSTVLTRAYRQMKPEDKAVKYQNLMQNVTIFETVPDLSDIHAELREKDTEIKDLKQQMRDVQMELLEMKLTQVQNLQKKEKEKNK